MSLRNSLHAFAQYVRYFLCASNGRGHGVHSPFVYSFIRAVLMDHQQYAAFQSIELIRKQLEEDPSLLEFQDLGAGSSHFLGEQRRVNDIAKTSAKSAKYAQLLFRIVKHYQYRQLLELGTSLGISTSYLASATNGGYVTTLEGVPSVAQRAAALFTQQGLSNVSVLTGAFDHILPELLRSAPNYDLVFIDGNHRKEPTLLYFKQLIGFMNQRSLMIFDDIYWSEEMTVAWEEIKKDSRVFLTVDLFQFGLVFFDPSFKVPQHFRIRF